MMNACTLVGRLTDDPRLKHIGKDGRPLCEMRIAVDNGRHPTTYIDVSAFDGQAYSCAEYLSRGRLVGVDGRLAQREWHDDGGKRHERYSVIGRVQFLDRPPKEPAPEPAVVGGDPRRTPELALAV